MLLVWILISPGQEHSIDVTSPPPIREIYDYIAKFCSVSVPAERSKAGAPSGPWRAVPQQTNSLLPSISDLLPPKPLVTLQTSHGC